MMERQAGDTAADALEAGYIRQLFDQYGLLFYDGGMGNGWLDADLIEAEFERYYRGNLTTGLTLNGKSFFGVGTVGVIATEIMTATDYNGAVFIDNALDYFPYDAAGQILKTLSDQLGLIGQGEEAKKASEAQEKERKETDWSDYTVSSNGEAGSRSAGNGEGGSRSAGNGEGGYRSMIYGSAGSLILEKKPGKPGSGGDKEIVDSDPDKPGSGSGKPGGQGGGKTDDYGSGKPEDNPGETTEPEKNKFDKKRYEEEIENSPIGNANQVKAKGWLSLVMPKGRSVSVYTLDQSNSPSKTAVDTREAEDDPKDSPLKRAAFNEYLMLEFACFTDNKETDVTQYELEYLLYGKSVDQDNLMAVLDRLMWLREGMNLLYLIQCEEKMEEVSALASMLAGWTEIPALIVLTEAALLASWAYAESLLDVRELLAGGKSALVKTDVTWNLGLSNISDFMRGSDEIPSKNDTGMTYKDYLRLFLYLSDSAETAYHAMDLIQAEMQKHDPAFRMSAAVASATFVVHSGSSSLFSRLPLLQASGASYFSVYTLTDKFSFLY